MIGVRLGTLPWSTKLVRKCIVRSYRDARRELNTETDLLRDGLNSHLEPELNAGADRPAGCVARRREAYYAQIAAQGDLASRLRLTTHLGLPKAA